MHQSGSTWVSSRRVDAPPAFALPGIWSRIRAGIDAPSGGLICSRVRTRRNGRAVRRIGPSADRCVRLTVERLRRQLDSDGIPQCPAYAIRLKPFLPRRMRLRSEYKRGKRLMRRLLAVIYKLERVCTRV